MTFVFLDKPSTIDAAQPVDPLDPTNVECLDQSLFLFGYGVKNPSDGMHVDEEYRYVVELPARNPFEEPSEWTIKVNGYSAFSRWNSPIKEAFERTSSSTGHWTTP